MSLWSKELSQMDELEIEIEEELKRKIFFRENEFLMRKIKIINRSTTTQGREKLFLKKKKCNL